MSRTARGDSTYHYPRTAALPPGTGRCTVPWTDRTIALRDKSWLRRCLVGRSHMVHTAGRRLPVAVVEAEETGSKWGQIALTSVENLLDMDYSFQHTRHDSTFALRGIRSCLAPRSRHVRAALRECCGTDRCDTCRTQVFPQGSFLIRHQCLPASGQRR